MESHKKLCATMSGDECGISYLTGCDWIYVKKCIKIGTNLG